jgi:hypothetical protein
MVLFSIFGISLIDFYEINAISKIFHNILDIFSNFYTNLTELFIKKPDVQVPLETSTPSRLKPFDPNATGSKESNKIIERFSKVIHGKEDLPIQETIIEDKSNPFYENKYVIIGGLLILSGLAWYFYDDLKPYGSAVLAWINAHRSKPKSDTDNPTEINTVSTNKDEQGENKEVIDPVDLVPDKSKLQRFKDWLSNKFNWTKKDENTPSVDSIELINNSNPEAKSLKEKLYNQFFKEEKKSEEEWLGNVPSKLNGLKDITGESNKFNTESFNVLNEIEIFTDVKDSSKFTDPKIKSTIYDMLRDRLHKLSSSNPDLFKALLKNNSVQNKINDFLDLEKEIYPSEIIEVAKTMKSPTYEEIAMATVEEQDHWSDRAKSPSVKDGLLSPLYEPKEAPSEEIGGSTSWNLYTEKGLKIEVEDSLMKKHLVQDVKNRPSSYGLDQSASKAEETNVAARSLFDQLRDSGNNKINDIFKKAEINEPLKTIDSNITIPDFNDSNDSMEHYFPKAKVFDNQITDKTEDLSVLKPYVKAPKDSDLMNAIEESKSDGVKEKREGISDMINAKDVHSTPNIANVGLQHSIDNIIPPSPWLKKSSLSNLFDNFNEVYDDTAIDIEESNGNSNENKDESPNTQEVNNPTKQNVFSTLLQQIKSQRKEYGTPLNTNKDLSEENPEEPEDLGEPEDLEEDISPINWKDEIKLEIKRGDIKDRFIHFNFCDKFNDLTKIYIITNDGGGQYIDIHSNNSANQSIKWDNKGLSNPDHKELDIFKIYVMDSVKPKLSQEIYTNPNAKILDSFHKNKVGRNY